MTDARAGAYTQHLKAHDRELFCRRPTLHGPYQVFRKGTRWETHPVSGGVLRYSRPVNHYVLALTHDWSLNGRPIEWGIEPLLARVKEIDGHNRDVGQDVLDQQTRVKESKERAFRSESEAFLKDFRREYARATDHINTSNLSKVDPRRKQDGRY